MEQQLANIKVVEQWGVQQQQATNSVTVWFGSVLKFLAVQMCGSSWAVTYDSQTCICLVTSLFVTDKLVTGKCNRLVS